MIGVTSTSIEISWSPPDHGLPGGSIVVTLHFLIFSFIGSLVTSYHIEAAGRSIKLDPDTTSYVLTSLIPETTYELVKIHLPGSD